MAVTALLRLVKLTGRADLQEKAEATLRLYAGLLKTQPLAAGQMLVALDFHLGPVQEFAVVGDPGAEDTRRVLRAIRGGFRPNQVVALKPADGGPAAGGAAYLRTGRKVLGWNPRCVTRAALTRAGVPTVMVTSTVTRPAR